MDTKYDELIIQKKKNKRQFLISGIVLGFCIITIPLLFPLQSYFLSISLITVFTGSNIVMYKASNKLVSIENNLNHIKNNMNEDKSELENTNEQHLINEISKDIDIEKNKTKTMGTWPKNH